MPDMMKNSSLGNTSLQLLSKICNQVGEDLREALLLRLLLCGACMRTLQHDYLSYIISFHPKIL